MERGFLTMTYYLEIGTAAQLIALHGLANDAGGDGTGGVEIVSGWASDEPYHSIAVIFSSGGFSDDSSVVWATTRRDLRSRTVTSHVPTKASPVLPVIRLR